MQGVGVVKMLRRYPVKSMRGESLDAANLTLQGIAEDRRYAFVQSESRSGFPWLTARELPEMLLYQPAVVGTDPPTVKVTSPSGETWPIESEELRKALAAKSGRAIHLMRDHRGNFDVGQISVISRQTVARLAEESGTPENAIRFRPNLLVELHAGDAYDELNWVGRVLCVGMTARIAITQVDFRCMMITLDPATAQASPSVLRCVAQQHENRAGVYGSVLSSGEIRVGDTVALENG
jgi:uncharacterized protein YcbX